MTPNQKGTTMRHLIRTTLAALAAILLTIAAATVAGASYYRAYTWRVVNDFNARLSVTVYTKGTGYEIHMDCNSGAHWRAWKIIYDGATIGVSDQYRQSSRTNHTVTCYWDANGEAATSGTIRTA